MGEKVVRFALMMMGGRFEVERKKEKEKTSTECRNTREIEDEREGF